MVVIVSGSVRLDHLAGAISVFGHVRVAVAALDGDAAVVVRIHRFFADLFDQIFEAEGLTAGSDLRQFHIRERLPLLDVDGLDAGASVADDGLAFFATLLLLLFFVVGDFFLLFVVDVFVVAVASVLVLIGVNLVEKKDSMKIFSKNMKHLENR
jgi:hypothetical protein